MLLDDLYAMPGHLIRRSQQIAVSLFMEETAAFGVTPVQYAALVAIREQPDVDATRLSLLIAFDRSTIGSVLGRLEGKGLIARKSGSVDKRIKRLRITRRGSRLLDQIARAVAQAQERILAPLAPAERRQFMAMLTRLVHVNNRYSRVPLGTVDAGGLTKSSLS
jgi:MarR family transcriptional regulator, lower aerobic nicotinate degradation pathway regulator